MGQTYQWLTPEASGKLNNAKLSCVEVELAYNTSASLTASFGEWVADKAGHLQIGGGDAVGVVRR